jgi:KDO2-lipid IV(A) lauroyltransferase
MGSRHSSLRYRFEDAAFVFAGLMLKALPIAAASWISGKIWRVIGPLVSRRHERALTNLALAYPQRNEAELCSIALDMWENLGRTFAETFRLKEIASSGRVTFTTPDVIQTASAAQGHIVCAPHQANWEIAVLAISACTEKPPAGVYQRIKNPRVDARVREMRTFLYPGGLYPKNSKTARQLIRHAREGGTIAMLADQRDFRGVRVPFFERPAPSTPFPAMAARTYGLKLYSGQIIRHPGVRFTIRLVEIEVRKTEDRDRDIFEATAAIQSEFERTIRENPGQWMWSHRRWG